MLLIPRLTPGGSVAGRLDLDFVATDDMQAPLTVLVHSANLPDVLDRNVRVGLISAQNEVRTVFLEISTFAESEVAVLGVVLEAVCLVGERASWVLIAVLAVAWWVRVLVTIGSVAVPPTERFIEFFEDSLRRLGIEVLVAVVSLEVGLERAVAGNLADRLPDTAGSPAANIPEFRRGEAGGIEVIGHL